MSSRAKLVDPLQRIDGRSRGTCFVLQTARDSRSLDSAPRFARESLCFARDDSVWLRDRLQFRQPMPDNQPDDKKSFLVQIAKYSQLAFIFPAATVAGWLLGLAADRWLHTTWLYLVGLILGIVAGFVELIRTVASSDSK